MSDFQQAVANFRNGEAVPQEHSLGCGVACVASRSGLLYSQALKHFSEPTNAWQRGYYCEDLIEALARIGFRYEYAAFDPRLHSKRLEQVGTIVFVDPCPAYPAGHYLVKQENGWMNSWINYPQMIPVKAGFQDRLPGQVSYLLYER